MAVARRRGVAHGHRDTLSVTHSAANHGANGRTDRGPYANPDARRRRDRLPQRRGHLDD
jgi:hypothetical protein